jgi:GntR family transcriptional repressor for pyruvate dehydrogenase complex
VLGSAFAPALLELFARHDEAVFDYLSFRRDMEALAIERAAKYASDTDLAVVQTVFNKMEAAHAKRNAEEEAQLDAQFHMAIIEASHNVVMLHMMRSMYELLRGGVFYNRQIMFKQRTSRAALLDQHRAINDALQARDPDQARAAIEAHLNFVESSLTDQRKAERNEDIARQRLQHETEQ